MVDFIQIIELGGWVSGEVLVVLLIFAGNVLRVFVVYGFEEIWLV